MLMKLTAYVIIRCALKFHANSAVAWQGKSVGLVLPKKV